MVEFFYNCKLDRQDCDKIHGIRPFLYTPAEVSKILFENFGNKDGAIDCLIKELAEEEKELTEEEKESTEEEKESKENNDTFSIYNSGLDSNSLSYEPYSSSMSSSLYK
jgi:hypothetical protein